MKNGIVCYVCSNRIGEKTRKRSRFTYKKYNFGLEHECYVCPQCNADYMNTDQMEELYKGYREALKKIDERS